MGLQHLQMYTYYYATPKSLPLIVQTPHLIFNLLNDMFLLIGIHQSSHLADRQPHLSYPYQFRQHVPTDEA